MDYFGLLLIWHVGIWVIQVIIYLVFLKIIDPLSYMRELYCNGRRGASGIEAYRSVRSWIETDPIPSLDGRNGPIPLMGGTGMDSWRSSYTVIHQYYVEWSEKYCPKSRIDFDPPFLSLSIFPLSSSFTTYWEKQKNNFIKERKSHHHLRTFFPLLKIVLIMMRQGTPFKAAANECALRIPSHPRGGLVGRRC